MPDCERGQTEVLGFLLIFSLVVIAIALVGITAFTGLDNAQEFQETTSTEQAFVVLADNVDDVSREGAPSRETEISLSKASLSLGGTEQINVTVDGGNTTEIETDPIVYRSRDDTSISYSSGLLVREDGESGLVFRRPEFVLTSEAVILPIVSTTAVEKQTVAGTVATQVTTRSNGTRVLAADDFESTATVTIEVSSPRAEVWAEYLGGTGADCTIDGGTVECDIETEELFVSVEDIEVTLR